MEKKTEFQAGTATLRGKFVFASDQPANSPFVLLATGYGGSGLVDEIWGRFMDGLAARGISSFVFDYSGQGASAGDLACLTPLTAVSEMEAAIQTLTYETGAKRSRISLLAVSFGGIVALQVAAKWQDLHALALVSPVSDYCEVSRLLIGVQGIARWKQQGYYDFDFGRRVNYQFYTDSEALDILALAKSIHIPCLIVHGDADPSVPVEQSRRLAASLGGKTDLVILPGVDHDYEGNSMEVMIRTVVDWLAAAYDL